MVRFKEAAVEFTENPLAARYFRLFSEYALSTTCGKSANAIESRTSVSEFPHIKQCSLTRLWIAVRQSSVDCKWWALSVCSDGITRNF